MLVSKMLNFCMVVVKFEKEVLFSIVGNAFASNSKRVPFSSSFLITVFIYNYNFICDSVPFKGLLIYLLIYLFFNITFLAHL